MALMKRICVFCGGLSGKGKGYIEAAEQFGRLLAEHKIGLVYGGGSVGLMGALADSILAAGGEAVGVIPQSLVDREIGHKGLTELKVVKTMHERKAMMAELADAFVALPGGYGTLEELFEIKPEYKKKFAKQFAGLQRIPYSPNATWVSSAVALSSAGGLMLARSRLTRSSS